MDQPPDRDWLLSGGATPIASLSYRPVDAAINRVSSDGLQCQSRCSIESDHRTTTLNAIDDPRPLDTQVKSRARAIRAEERSQRTDAAELEIVPLRGSSTMTIRLFAKATYLSRLRREPDSCDNSQDKQDCRDDLDHTVGTLARDFTGHGIDDHSIRFVLVTIGQ